MTKANFTSGVLAVVLLAICLLVAVLEDQYQAALTPALVLLSVAFALAWCLPLASAAGRRDIDWFHPSVMLTGFYLVYFVFSGIWLWVYHDYESEFVDLGAHAALIVNQTFCMGFLSLAGYGLGARAHYVGARAFTGRVPQAAASTTPGTVSLRELVMVALVFFVVGAVFKIYHFAQYGTPSADILLYLSPTAALDLGLNISQFVIMMESMLDWAVLLAVLYVIVKYKATGKASGLWWVCGAAIVVGMLDYSISGKRSAVIFFVVLPVIWYHYLIKSLTKRSAFTVLVILTAAIVALLLGRIVLPLLMQGLVPTDYVGVNPLEVLVFYLDSGEISTFDMVAATIVRKDELLLQAGGTLAGFLQFTFSSLTVFIPRLVWPDKPDYLDLSHIYRLVLVGPEEGMGIAPTVWGAGYLFFGVAGLAVMMFFIGWIYEAIYATLNPRRGGVASVVVYSIFLWMTFQAIRFGTMGFVTLLVVQTMIVGLIAMWFLGRRRGGGAYLPVDQT